MSDNKRGCGDSSCVTRTDHTGQNTNGGCRCTPVMLKRRIWELRQALEEIQKWGGFYASECRDCAELGMTAQKALEGNK